MSLLLSCPTGPTPNVCPPTNADVMDSVLGLLPPGLAWEGAQIEGTVQNSYWRAYANVLNFLYARMCSFVDEFFCHTVNESLDQWVAEYGLNDPCDPYGNNLCAKVAATGGATCDYFVSIAQGAGWDIACHDLSKDPEPIAGCFEIGCTPLGPTPTYCGPATNLSYGQRGLCQFGEVVAHPEPSFWDNAKTGMATCPVPGSNLGHGPDTDESCCFIVGWYEYNPPAPPTIPDYCQSTGDTIYFDCPRVDVPKDPIPGVIPRQVHQTYDSTGNYSEWGNSFIWIVTVNVGPSQVLQQTQAAPVQETISAAGNFMVGNIVFSEDGTIGGTPLCTDVPASPEPTFILCFLDRIKPAHTTLIVEVNQPS